jgi:ABC-type molybdate transport system substrate-binding protein
VPGFEAVPLPTTDAPPVFYTASVGRTAKNPDMARSFLEYCSGSDAKAIWEKFGFETD